MREVLNVLRPVVFDVLLDTEVLDMEAFFLPLALPPFAPVVPVPELDEEATADPVEAPLTECCTAGVCCCGLLVTAEACFFCLRIFLQYFCIVSAASICR